MEMPEELWYEVGYIYGSKNRQKVIKVLAEGPKMPSQIAVATEIYPNHISLYLNQLKEHGLAECINPEIRKGRMYRLTKTGEKVAENFTGR